jgi:transcriptional regulator with XRE-family HTH domain
MASIAGTGAGNDIGIGGRVRIARQRLGWKREALAFHSGMSWSGIAQVEGGRRVNLRPATLSALARALGVSIDYLVEGSPPAPMLEHRVLLYESDEEFREVTAAFLGEAIELSYGALAVTTPARIKALRAELGPLARRVVFAEQASWYATPATALQNYRGFLQAQLAKDVPWVHIVGEVPAANARPAEARLWARYESLLTLVLAMAPASILCPYDVRELDRQTLNRARATHSHAIEQAQLIESPEYSEPGIFVLES